MPAGWCGRLRPAAPHGRSADHRYPAALDASRHAVRIDGDETARANAALLRRALVNLLCNAARHTVVGQTIVVRIDRADGAARMAVVNPGAPIPQPVLDRMFDRFWRGDAARAKSTQGRSGWRSSGRWR